MSTNSFATKLQHLLKLSNVKNTTLANAVQYDLSYISKWLSGKMIPSDKNIDIIIQRISKCLIEADCEKLLQDYNCDMLSLQDHIQSDLEKAYEECRPKLSKDKFQAVLSISEVVQSLDVKTRNGQKVFSVIDLFSLPHENRLVLAGIKNSHFVEMPCTLEEYSMIININSSDYIYDSIFLIHMLTCMSNIEFRLYRSEVAAGKLIYCIDTQAISAFLFPGNKDCVAVNELSNGQKIQQSITPLFNQENLIFRKTTISNMIFHREYFQTLISTNIRWILGHATELLLPEEVFKELLAADDRDTSEYTRLYSLSQRIISKKSSRIMIYESAIANLVVDGIIDFYNRPILLSRNQILKCLEYYENILQKECQIKLIDGGFSDDFKYITNPCMFFSDSLCYVRLENNRYSNNVLILNDRIVKEMFDHFFEAVWNHRKDVVTEDELQIKDKIEHYKESAIVLMNI